METQEPARLTSLSHGGGCGCKISPKGLQDILKHVPASSIPIPKELLVGIETSDDACCVVATTDFFMPILDDPRDFGRVAATNALSDVYAMGATPIFALAIVSYAMGATPIFALAIVAMPVLSGKVFLSSLP
ncbi:PurM, N-terminal-like protein [Baffinella frigidus]|nr:PurM, N-terminal-like protein [Cryptophyta sp. CCMP2293]